MKILLLLLVLIAVFVLGGRCKEAFGDHPKPAGQAANSVHVSIWDGSNENDSIHIKGQIARINAITTFGSYWHDVLQKTPAGDPKSQEAINALVYKNVNLNNIQQSVTENKTSGSSRIEYVIGTLPLAEVYEFYVPALVGQVTHRLGDVLENGSLEKANHQRYLTEFICRPDVIPVVDMQTKEQFFNYIRDYIKENVSPFLQSLSQKNIHYTPEYPLFSFKFVP